MPRILFCLRSHAVTTSRTPSLLESRSTIKKMKNKGTTNMSRSIFTILSAGILTLVSTTSVEAQDNDRMAKFVPTELYACKYNDGQGADDLDAVVGKWNAYMDENEADTYLAWTMTPQYFTDEQDFDVLWLGAWADGNAMGQGRDNYQATGGAISAEFGKVLDCGAHVGFVSRAFKLPPDDAAGPPNTSVIAFTDCTIEEGATYDTIVAGLLAWAKTLGDNGSKAAMYQWWPVYGGGGETTLDFKLLSVHPNHASLGADLERLANGELWRKRMEHVGDQFDCDVSRVYDAKLRRAAKVR